MTNHKKLFKRLSPLLLLIFIDSLSFFIIIPVLLKLYFHTRYGLLPMTTSLHTRETLTGITISLAMITALIFAPIIGQASDKFGRKRTLLFCICCVLLGFLLPMIGILKKSIVLIFIGRLIAGIGSASQPVAQASVADLCHTDEKALYLSLIAVMMTLALILGPLAGGFLSDPHWVHSFTITTPFVFAIGLSGINLLLVLFLFRETKKSHQPADVASLRQVITGLPLLIKRYHVGLLILLFIALELAWSQYYQSIGLFLQTHAHFSVDKISLFNATMGVIMAAGLLLLYPLLLRFLALAKIMRASLMVTAIGLILCAVFPTSSVQWIFSSLIALGTGCAYVSLVALISNKTPDHAQGLVMGYLSALLYCAWMITSFVSGFLISLTVILPLVIAALWLCVPMLVYRKKI